MTCIHVQARVCSLAGNPDVELALNLVWLVLTAISLLLWGVYVLSSPPGHRYFTAIIALICVMAFLFPVISMSDDLHRPALCETGKFKKWLSAGLAEALLSSPSLLPPPAEPAARQAANLHAEVCLPSRDLVWFTLDRRPPPQRS